MALKFEDIGANNLQYGVETLGQIWKLQSSYHVYRSFDITFK